MLNPTGNIKIKVSHKGNKLSTIDQMSEANNYQAHAIKESHSAGKKRSMMDNKISHLHYHYKNSFKNNNNSNYDQPALDTKFVGGAGFNPNRYSSNGLLDVTKSSSKLLKSKKKQIKNFIINPDSKRDSQSSKVIKLKGKALNELQPNSNILPLCNSISIPTATPL